MGIGAGLYMCDVVKKSSRSLSHLLMSSCIILSPHAEKRNEILQSLKNMPYGERQKICTTPISRCIGDMIEIYKIVTGKYQPYVAPTVPPCIKEVDNGHVG